MKPIRVLVVDDEPLAREGLELLLKTDPEVEMVGFCEDGQAAVEAIREHRPDVVFLDVQMPRLDGFGTISAIPPTERPVIVFVTAYQQHAVRAFEVCALDYLLKPFSNARFMAALRRAKDVVRRGDQAYLAKQVESLLEHVKRLQPTEAGAAPVTPPVEVDLSDRVVIKVDGAMHFVSMRDILWVEAQGDFVKVHTHGKTHLVRDTLQSFEQRLDHERFLRIHRSFIVNIAHVRRVEPALYGDYSVYMSDGTKLRLSRSYRAQLDALLKRTPRS